MSYVRPTLVYGTASAVGTGNPSLTDVTGYVTASTVPDGSTGHYVIRESPDSANIEWGLGTKTTVAGKPVIQRTAANVVGGTNGLGNLTNFTGSKQLVYFGPIGEVEVLPNVGSDPSVASSGQITFRTDTSRLRGYDGANWGNVVQEHIANTWSVGPQTILTGADGNVGEKIRRNGSSQSVDVSQWEASAGNPRARVTAACEFSNPNPNDCTGTLNEVFGVGAGASLTGGVQNTLLGWHAGFSLATGNLNTAIGPAALGRSVADNANFALGNNTLPDLNGGAYNVAVGYAAGTGLGYGVSLLTGNQNTFVGAQAGAQASSTSFGIALGVNAACQSNECALSPVINVQAFYVASSTNALRQRADFTVENIDNTDATRKYRIKHNAWDTAQREYMRGEASGTAPLIGFLGATAVAQQSIGAAATDAASTQTLANNIRTALINLGLCKT